jgi:hypothetical protein
MKLFLLIRRHITPLAVLCCFVFASQVARPQLSFAQSDPPLTFGNNFFVTGDYVVAGAQNMTTNFVTISGNSYAKGTITVPDPNPGIQPGKTSTCTIIVKGQPTTKTNCVPAGADILTALLYWQTVEKVGVTPGGPGSGQNGFFGPVLNTGPQLYPIAGATSSQSTVSFSNGGCTGGSTGKIVKTYRADVRGYLPQDANGNILANGAYQVMLPSTSSTTPITLGATLVIIYRVLSPNVPLNSIVIYDGSFAPGGTLLSMTQTVQGFYDAANAPVSRLTHIVGSTHSNKFQNVYLNDLTKPLPSLYPGLPPFPGFYGPWDNPTWTFPDKNGHNPVQPGDSSATTMVAPTTSQGGCPSWGAVIVSTTVKNTDGDGLLDVQKANQGYCDASIHEGSCTVGDPSTGWVALPGTVRPTPNQPHPDVFVQLDYMCSKVTGAGTCDTSQANVTSFSILSNVITVIANNSFSVGDNVLLQIQMPSVDYLTGVYLTVSTASTTQFTAPFTHANVSSTLVTVGTANHYSFDPRLTADTAGDGLNVVDKVVAAFATTPNHTPVTLHVIPTNAIQEQTCNDILGPPLQLCPFPNQPGVVGWPGGVLFFQNQLIDTTGNICTTSTTGCVPVFQRGKKDSYHYALFAHALGLANLNFPSGTLTDSTGKVPGLVTQSGNTVTFYAAHGHGLVKNDSVDGNGRVTVAFATSNPNLNGTWYVTSVTCPVNPATNPPTGLGDCSASNTAPGPYTFTIQIGTSASTSYTYKTDPNLVVASGQAGQVSGFSDIGGAHTLVTLGNWKPSLQTWQVKAGTFMHELGHSLGLTHGGFYFDKLSPSAQNPNDFTPTIEANCKPNHQSVMNYDFQIDLLDTGTVDAHGLPIKVPDYSGQALETFDKSNAGPLTLFSPTYPITAWHGTATQLGGTVGSRFPVYCDGTPIPTGTDLFRVYRNTSLLSWVGGQNINLDGNANDSAVLRAHDDWKGSTPDPITDIVMSPGIDMRQTSATGSLSAAGLVAAYGGLVPPQGGGGGLVPPGGGGGGLVPPGGGGGGLVPPQGGGGGLVPPGGGGGGIPAPAGMGGGGGLVPPQGGGGGLGEITQAIANSFTRPPQHLTASEEVSPRFIDLSWMKPDFGDIGAYLIFRLPDGGTTTPIATVPGTQLTFQDTVTCKPTGYQYYVKAVLAGTFATFPPGPNEGQQSVPSNTASTGQNGELLTGCYTPPVFLSPAAGSSPLAGSSVTVKWTVQDASNKAGTSANNPGSNSLVAIGPISNDVACISSTVNPPVNTPRTTISAAGVGITFAANTFTFNWSTSLGFVGGGAFPPGCYRLELDLDSGQPLSGQDPSPFQVQFFLSDVNESVVINTTSLADATVGVPYSQTLLETGGVPLLNWTLSSGSLPTGFNLDQALGKISGTTLTAGTSQFTAQVTDSIGDFGTKPLTLTVHIFVSTSQPPANPPFVATTTLTDAVVGSPYNNTVYESGGISDGATPFTWAIVPNSVMPGGGSTLPGLSFQANAAGVTNGTLSGTPTATGTFTFTAMVTDSAGNTGTQTLTLKVADALFGDLIVVDGIPSGTPSGTLFRITTDGAVSATIASISNGSPTGVAVDPNTGNIFVAVALGTPRIVEVTRFGTVSNFVPGGVLASPVAVAVDSSGNVYIGDNSTDKIYKFNSAGAQVDANGNTATNPFASLPASPADLQDIRMTFDSAGNLIVASDSIGDVSGQVEVDKIDPTGAVTALYNTTANSSLIPAITSVGGIAVFADGSIDVADFSAQAIYKIANPGTGTMAISAAVGPTGGLCCNISGMANPPSQVNTTLYVTLNGVGGSPTRLQLAVPETSSVTTVLSAPLTFANDVTWFQPRVTYFVDGFANFGTLDLTTGVTKVIGTGTVPNNTGMDLTPTGQVYEYNGLNQLIQVNPTTGAATVVGSGSLPNPGFTTTGGLTNGSYFGIDALSGNLYSINLAMGTTTLVGPTATATRPSGCGFHTSLAGSANVLYYTIGFGGRTCTTPMNDTLYQIDPASGTTTTIGQVSVNGFVGSAFVGGKLYGFTFNGINGQEYSINPATGVATFVTNTTTAVFGAASTIF